MADRRESPRGMEGVVQDVTVKALQEFDTGDMSAQDGSRPASAKSVGSRPPSGRTPSSRGGGASRPTSGASVRSQQQKSKTPTPRGSRVGSGASTPVARSPSGSLQDVRSPSGSRQDSRPGSAESGSQRPQSRTSDKSGSRAQSRTSSDKPGSRPQSRTSDRPGSRPISDTKTTSRPVSEYSQPVGDEGLAVTGSRPTSSRRQGEATQQDRSSSNVTADYEGQWATLPEEDTDRQAPGTTDMVAATGEYDEEDEEEGEYAEEEEESEESEGENEMVVLDPDHPLMRRFQKALKSHLEKVDEKVTLELKELQEAVKNKKGDRESVGVELYGVQQELARHQMMLEKYHDSYAIVKQDRSKMETQLLDVRNQYRDNQYTVTDERKKGAELQAEVENLALRLFYMENAKEDVRSDIAVMKRAAEKAESEVGRAETEKQKQDLFVDRLIERVDKLREEISMFEAQLTAQLEETKAAKEALTEAHMEIDSINLEKKQLFQQWNSSLIGMRRRDEAHSAMQEALNQQQQRILSLETEIEGYKKSISKEQEQNEKLTLIFQKTEADINTVKKMLQQCQNKHEALKNEYATYSRMLHETEQSLNRANTDKILRQNEVNALRKQIEREYLEKVKLEDEILEKLRTQLTMDKASQYTDKLTGKLRQRTKDLEAQTAEVENEISKDTLEVGNVVTRIERLNKILASLDEDIRQKNEIISRSEAEIVKRNAVIERKQGVIDQYNKKLEQMISQAGGVELGPLEIQINSLQKSIEKENEEIQELQQMWLRDQSELVRVTKEKQQQTSNVENMKKKLTILVQKKLRMEHDINHQNTEIGDVQRNIRSMQNDMLKLNTLLHRERGIEHNLQQTNILKESDFIGSLKEAEKESIEMQEKLEALKEEKERLLNSLVEAERQIMLWEKKTQLARETKAAVDSEVGQGEIRAMKAEIHRMQVRFSQLMKQQEKMIQEMEKSVSRRDTIVTRGDAQAKMNKKVLTKGTFKRQMAELKKKIKTTVMDANGCDGDIKELRDHQQELGGQLEDKQLNVQQLQSNADTMDGDVERLIEAKHKNLSDLLSKQQRSKYYQQVKEGKYTRLCKTDGALDAELQKQVDRMQTVNAIADRLVQEFPHVQPVLRKVSLTYGSRGLPDD